MKSLFRITLLILIMGHFCEAKTEVENPQQYESKELVVSGEVQQILKFTVSELQKLEMKTLMLNPKACVTGQSKRPEESYRGVLLKDLLMKAGIVGKAHNDVKKIVVIAKATDGYTVVFSWGELFVSQVGEGVLIATEKNGLPLNAKEGKMALLSVKDTQNSRHVRWLSSIEVRKL